MAGLGIALQAPIFEFKTPLKVTAITVAFHESGYWLVEALTPGGKAEHLFFDDDGQPLPADVKDASGIQD